MAEVTGAGRGPGDRPLARMADARDVSGLHWSPEVWFEVGDLLSHRSSAGGGPDSVVIVLAGKGQRSRCKTAEAV